MKQNKLTGIIAILVAVFVWGISFVNIRVAIQVIPAMTLGGLRFAIASVLLFIVMRLRRESLALQREDFFNVFIAGAIGITIYFYFENNGVKYTSASAASLIIASIPVFSVIIESLIYKKGVTKRTIISLACSIIGVCLVVGLDLKALIGSGYIKGYLMMGGAVLSWVAYSVTSTPLFEKYSQLKVLFWQSIVGLTCFTPFAMMENTVWADITQEMWIHVVILGVFASAVGFWVYLYALDVLGIGESSYYLNLIPVVTIIAGYFYLGETLSTIQLFGGLVIILSVFMISSGTGSENHGLADETLAKETA
jgi:drug/metabolite transporter (DMT)-like permease